MEPKWTSFKYDWGKTSFKYDWGKPFEGIKLYEDRTVSCFTTKYVKLCLQHSLLSRYYDY